MREHTTIPDAHDSEYRETKKKGITSTPSDGQFLDFLESDIGRYESLPMLERATDLILDRVTSSYSVDAAVRLRDIHAKRIVAHMVREAKTFGELQRIKAEVIEFPFECTDLREGAYAVYDREMTRACQSLIELVKTDRTKLARLRGTIGEFPFINEESHRKVLGELSKAEKALSIHLN